jgi:hypothetical protein
LGLGTGVWREINGFKFFEKECLVFYDVENFPKIFWTGGGEI